MRKQHRCPSPLALHRSGKEALRSDGACGDVDVVVMVVMGMVAKVMVEMGMVAKVMGLEARCPLQQGTRGSA